LVAVLDWGLGHATRCIPLIVGLQTHGCKVSIAGNGASFQLLKQEFPDLTFYELSSYKISYPSHGFFFFHLFFRMPHIISAIRNEQKEIKNLVRKYPIDAIISDNRYGCYSEEVQSILITHQLNIQLPLPLIWSKPLVDLIMHRLIKKFDACWLPDFPDSRFTGKLTITKNRKVSWIGILSRFKKTETKVEEKLIVGIISGPEPQRELFEKILLKELKKTNQPCIVLQGLPTQKEKERRDGNIISLAHASTQEFQWIISKADVIIARSGYSTLMDLQALEKKRVIFVPTPGQTEQEYLAIEMDRRKIAMHQSQNDFDLREAMGKLSKYSGFEAIDHPVDLLNAAISTLLREL
jgi:uncharacterized protein (TIGR00661 family)